MRRQAFLQLFVVVRLSILADVCGAAVPEDALSAKALDHAGVVEVQGGVWHQAQVQEHFPEEAEHQWWSDQHGAVSVGGDERTRGLSSGVFLQVDAGSSTGSGKVCEDSERASNLGWVDAFKIAGPLLTVLLCMILLNLCISWGPNHRHDAFVAFEKECRLKWYGDFSMNRFTLTFWDDEDEQKFKEVQGERLCHRMIMFCVILVLYVCSRLVMSSDLPEGRFLSALFFCNAAAVAYNFSGLMIIVLSLSFVYSVKFRNLANHIHLEYAVLAWLFMLSFLSGAFFSRWFVYKMHATSHNSDNSFDDSNLYEQAYIYMFIIWYMNTFSPVRFAIFVPFSLWFPVMWALLCCLLGTPKYTKGEVRLAPVVPVPFWSLVHDDPRLQTTLAICMVILVTGISKYSNEWHLRANFARLHREYAEVEVRGSDAPEIVDLPSDLGAFAAAPESRRTKAECYEPCAQAARRRETAIEAFKDLVVYRRGKASPVPDCARDGARDCARDGARDCARLPRASAAAVLQPMPSASASSQASGAPPRPAPRSEARGSAAKSPAARSARGAADLDGFSATRRDEDLSASWLVAKVLESTPCRYELVGLQAKISRRSLRSTGKLLQVSAEDAVETCNSASAREYLAFVTQTVKSDAASLASERSRRCRARSEKSLTKPVEAQPFNSVRHMSAEDLASNVAKELDFNCLELSRKTGNCAALFVGERLLVDHRGAEVLDVDAACVRSWVREVHSRYRNSNAYHNEAHAAQVAHFAFWMAAQTGWREIAGPVEVCAFILATFAHDVGHVGRSNLFLAKVGDPISLIWNDNSVLEQMHAATCFAIMRGEANLLQNLNSSDRSALRASVVRFIMMTDIKNHFQSIAKAVELMEDPEFMTERAQSGDQDATHGSLEEDILTAGEIFIKAADIGHSVLPWKVHKEWACRVMTEFFDQGDQELALGLPISPLCARTDTNFAGGQCFFLDHFVLPLIRVISQMTHEQSDGRSALEVCYDRTEAQKEKWREAQDSGFDPGELSLDKLGELFGRAEPEVVYPYGFSKDRVLPFVPAEKILSDLLR